MRTKETYQAPMSTIISLLTEGMIADSHRLPIKPEDSGIPATNKRRGAWESEQWETS